MIRTTILLLISLMPFLSSASDCKEIWPCYICGKAINSTPWAMKYTTNPSDAAVCPHVTTSHPDCCAVDNWTGTIGLDAESKNVICKQKTLGAGATEGGNTCHKDSRVDVDAVCFADRDYVLHVATGAGHDYPVTKGRWIKIGSNQTIKCEEKGGVPVCQVYGVL